jgi:hypothetical protein
MTGQLYYALVRPRDTPLLSKTPSHPALPHQVMLLSLVRANRRGEAGRLLADWQRLNVALTRAKAKLLLVGSAATVRRVPMLAALLGLLRERGWVLPLPADALAGLASAGAGAGAEVVVGERP